MSNKNYTIMVIEDEGPLLQAITKKLHMHGYETISCALGTQALDYLQELQELPDLIWLDYYLKDVNGLEFMHKVVNNEKTKNIPVVVVSNSASNDKVKTMLGLGVKKYILKAEHSLEEIIDAIDNVMRYLK